MVNDELPSALPSSPQTLSSQPRFARTQSTLIPSHINLPPTPPLALLSPTANPSPPYYTAPNSPALQFYTPPSSPLIDSPLYSPQPQSQSQPHIRSLPSLHITIPPPTPNILPDEPFPTIDYPIEPVIEDEGLSPLEKIYLYATSKATFHRLFIVHALPDFLNHIAPQEAVKYVLPLLSGLAVDEDEQVKEALASELVLVIWWFLTNCTLSNDDMVDSSSSGKISVQSFTLILGTLLLNPNPNVGSATRYVIVELLTRLKHADDREDGKEIVSDGADSDEDDHLDMEWAIGSFGRKQRDAFRNELLQQVVIGMSRLDVDVDDVPSMLASENNATWREKAIEEKVQIVTGGDEESGVFDTRKVERVRLEDLGDTKGESVNPYFSVEPRPNLASSPASSASSTPSTNTSDSLSSSSSSPGTAPTLTRIKEVRPSSPLASSTPPALNHRLDVEGRLSTASPNPLPPNGAIRRPLTSAALVSEGGEEEEQAAVGRLCSMSLMAAVSASGTLNNDTKGAFVREVLRVGQDDVSWVRSEASFALGALAKVVPEEIVISSLLPLFEKLRRDAVWQVRQSSLFALPAVLSRLPGIRRRKVALDTIETLWKDETLEVRKGVLDALGEVVYAFYGEEEGPPEALIEIFLGRREAAGVLKDEERALVCGFNYPAVAATMGRGRWKELREVYCEISRSEGVKVQRTLTASLGVLGEIIGGEQAERDLVGVWFRGIRSEWEEVRRCACESVEGLVGVVCSGVGDKMVREVMVAWDEGVFIGWRERERIVKKMGSRSEIVKRGLLDGVAAVRRAAIINLDSVSESFLISLKSSPIFHRRMTFIECCQALVNNNSRYLDHLADLVTDPVVDVRIALARLAGSLHHHHPHSHPILARLSQDTSHQVRSFVVNKHTHSSSSSKSNIFSRPPPPIT